MLIGEDRTLDTCFAFSAGGGLAVSSSASVSPLEILDVDPSDLDLGGISATASSVTSAARVRAFEAITRWNLLDDRLATLLANRRPQTKRPLRLDDVRVLGVVLHRWAKLAPADPRNLDLEIAGVVLGLADVLRKRLKCAGVTDLRGLAMAILSASAIERHNQRVERARDAFPAAGPNGPVLEPVAVRLAAKDFDALLRQIGLALQAIFTSGQTTA